MALLRDTRHGLRRLVRDWRFTAAAVLILGLGIGVNTALFSLINATLFRGRPFAESHRLVDVYQRGVNAGGVDANSYPAYLDIAAYTDVFAITTAVSVPRGVNHLHGGALRPAVVEHTTASYLSLLGLHPSLGRWFTESDDAPGAPVVAVVSHTAWVRKFRSDPSLVGRTLRIEGVPVTVVGVGPVDHNATIDVGLVTDFWLPIRAIPVLGGPSRVLDRNPEEAGFFVKARLRDGVTVAQAQAAMDILGQRLAAEFPDEDPGQGIGVFASRDVRIHPQMDLLLAPLAAVLLGLVGLVLAIACSNLATLLLVRGAARAKEVSVRLALGATRRQLVRHLLTESLLLAAAGGVAGCLLAWWAMRALAALDLPIGVDVSIDYRVLGFALAVSLGTGVVVGLAPALEATRIDLVPTLRDDGESRSSNRRWLTLKNALVVFQVAVSVVLLGVTSLVLQMRSASHARPSGFAVDGIAMLETDARYAGYAASEAGPVYEEVRRRVAAIPGVQSAVLTAGPPMQTSGVRLVVEEAGAGAADAPVVAAAAVWAGPGFFEMLRIPLVYGRAFDARDRPDTPRVAVISETTAREHFGAVNAVGRRVRFERDPGAWLEIIGVVRDTGTSDLAGDLVDPTRHVIYRSFAQWDRPPTTVLARTTLDATSLLGTLQHELRAVDPALPVVSAQTMAQYLERSLVGVGTAATFLGGLGALGLCLAGIGLYAVLAFAVSRRSREIGIRMALGAQSRQVVRTVAMEGAALVGLGTGAGLLLSLLAIRGLGLVVVPTPGISLYRPAADPVALLAIAAFMALVGLAAACVPARRAARMDPLVALRRD